MPRLSYTGDDTKLLFGHFKFKFQALLSAKKCGRGLKMTETKEEINYLRDNAMVTITTVRWNTTMRCST